jgi:dihydrofolate reductase
MRKLKLQVQMSADGFICGPNGEMDFMTWNWDDRLKKHVSDLTDSVDTILLGRKMTEGFISYWQKITGNPSDEQYPFARKMVDYPKYVFSKTIRQPDEKWLNTTVVNGDLAGEVSKLKKLDGKDIVVYGGASFNASLVKEGLIDEYNLFINPAAIGQGLSIFNQLSGRQNLKLTKSEAFDCGIVLLQYSMI